MASPFPGMDPYIEACGLWEDFHAKLIGEIERSLAAVLPERYVVRTGERSYIVLAPPGNGEHAMIPDVGVVTRRRPSRSGKQNGGTALAEPASPDAEPVTMRAMVDTQFRETFLEIRELNPRHRLVTSIEVLSPSNKRESTPGWDLYLRKRQAHLIGLQANLVELDLLRGGERMPMADDWPDSPYYVLVARKKESPRCTVWPAHFRVPLPDVRVPLAPPDDDARLALQPLVDAVYARSRYEQDINDHRPLRPAPGAADAAWLKQHGIGRKA